MNNNKECDSGSGCCNGIDRRSFLKIAGVGSLAVMGASVMPVMAGPFTKADFEKLVPADKKLDAGWVKSLFDRGAPQKYSGDALRYIGMPVGGFCAGQLYLGGDGTLWHWDIFNKHIATFQEHYANPLKVNSPVKQGFALKVTVNGSSETRLLNRAGFPDVSFRGEYPIGRIDYGGLPVSVSLEAFSPFIPLSVDDSSIPATVMRFTLTNNTSSKLEAELFGWLQNAVCINSGNACGKRINRVLKGGKLSFLSCSAEEDKLALKDSRPDIVFEDWSRDNYEGWTVEGTAFGSGPISRKDIPDYQGDVGGDTERVVNSHALAGGSDAPTGKLTSSKFKVERNYINFWIGGGAHGSKTCINLIVDGKAMHSATGSNNNQMKLKSFKVTELAGKEACIEIVDAEPGGWGNVGAGKITFSDKAPVSTEFDKLEDYGTMGLALLEHKADWASAVGGEKGPDSEQKEQASAGLSEEIVGGLSRRLTLGPRESGVVTFAVTWNFPNLENPGKGRYYAVRFQDAQAVAKYLAENIKRLYGLTELWRSTWYDSTLPYWFLDRTLANASILATSTAFRFGDGRFWGWEGVGCCSGTCTHVWHYEHTMGRLFPELDILLREKTDLNPKAALHADGSIGYRGAGGFAVDGQAGIILRCLRDHQVSPDSLFLKRNWQNIRKALEWLMAQDVNADGLLDQNQHNTLDAEWHGQVAWLSGLYLAALRAGEQMAVEMGDNDFAVKCRAIADIGKKTIVEKLWNGEYFYHTGDPAHSKSVGSYDGCEIDQVLGQSWAYQVGLGEVMPQKETKKALDSLWKYNFTPDVGPYREAYKAGRWYAMAGEAGTLMCSWPRGDDKRVTTGYDFYFNECMNGFEYQLAGHMVWENMVKEGLAIIRAVHDRYDGSKRNPWNEVECGDHYARSMASYGVFLAACGFEYHGPKGHIGFAPRLSSEDFRSAFTAAEGWGTYSQKMNDGGKKIKAEVDLKYGKLLIKSFSIGLPGGISHSMVKVNAAGRLYDAELASGQDRVTINLIEPVVLKEGEVLAVDIS